MNEFNLSLGLSGKGWLRRGLVSKAYVIGALLLAQHLTSCKSSVDFYEAKTVYSSRGKNVFPPPGMVYVPSGTVIYKSSAEGDRKVSLSPFFMDATEVTNYQYRDFVNWVADSIAVHIINDEKYFITPKKAKAVKSKKGATVAAAASEPATGSVFKPINWAKVRPHGSKNPLWKSTDPTIQSKLQEAQLIIELNGRPSLNKDIVKYSYFFRHAAGPNDGKYIKETVSVLPETDVWMNDFPNSQVEIMTENYYQTKAFDHYPVVGVNWLQARAYTNWRTKTSAMLIAKNNTLRNSALNYSLPTEAQWRYAATGGASSDDKEGLAKSAVLTYKDKKSKKDKLLVNYKQAEGQYTEDGSTFTLPVKSYAPNAFGLYNMNGNVAEWTKDAFSPSAIEFVHDLNPELQYDATDSDPAAMKRKVIRGGSWKDSRQSFDIDTRNYELQDASHSYIGFRCVMPALEVITDQVRTRKPKELIDKKDKSKSSDEKKSKSKKESDKKSA